MQTGNPAQPPNGSRTVKNTPIREPRAGGYLLETAHNLLNKSTKKAKCVN